jgi:membrane protein
MFGPRIGAWLAHILELGQVFEFTWNILRWPIALGCINFTAAALYYFTPDVQQKWKWVTPGSIFSVFGWILVSSVFAYYVNSFDSYNRTYGSIGTVIVLLTWLYLIGLFILIGGEINSEIEHAAREGKDPGEKTL